MALHSNVCVYLLLGICDNSEVLQLGLQLGLALCHTPSQLSLLSMLASCLCSKLQLTAL